MAHNGGGGCWVDIVVGVVRFRRCCLRKIAGSTRVPPYEQWLIRQGRVDVVVDVVSSVSGAATFTKSPAAPAFPVRAGAHNGGGGYWVDVAVLELLGW